MNDKIKYSWFCQEEGKKLPINTTVNKVYLNIDWFDGELIVHQADYCHMRWTVTEVETGCMVSRGIDKDSAILHAYMKINKAGPERYKDIIEDAKQRMTVAGYGN